MALDRNGFVERHSPEDIRTTYYTNVEKGVVFSAQDDQVIALEFFPSNREKRKRCEGFPPYDGVPPPRPFSIIFSQNKENVESVLDNFAAELSTNTQTRAYIIAYAGKKSRRNEAKGMAKDARQYLIDKRMISPERIVGIDGGFRETAEYELFSLKPQERPPTPTPTVPSNKVQIAGTRTRTRRGRGGR
jgi:hypothetical protein